MARNYSYHKVRKFNRTQVEQIKKLCSRSWFSYREVAYLFEASYRTIYDIAKGNSYKDYNKT